VGLHLAHPSACMNRRCRVGHRTCNVQELLPGHGTALVLVRLCKAFTAGPSREHREVSKRLTRYQMSGKFDLLCMQGPPSEAESSTTWTHPRIALPACRWLAAGTAPTLRKPRQAEPPGPRTWCSDKRDGGTTQFIMFEAQLRLETTTTAVRGSWRSVLGGRGCPSPHHPALRHLGYLQEDHSHHNEHPTPPTCASKRADSAVIRCARPTAPLTCTGEHVYASTLWINFTASRSTTYKRQHVDRGGDAKQPG
jgi:hypothetical protein